MLLWLMAAVVAVLGAYLFIGWTRRALGTGGGLSTLKPVLLAGSALGVSLPSSMLLALSAEALAFPLGYRWALVPTLVVLPVLACLVTAWWLSRRRDGLALATAGLALALTALAVQAGWLVAAGLRPGPRWHWGFIGAAAAVSVVGITAALRLACPDTSGDASRRLLQRLGGAVLIAGTLVSSQELMISASGLLSQTSSVFRHEASSTSLSLVSGVVVPIVLAALALDLVLRNSTERRHRLGGGYEGTGDGKRRKRRRRYRML